MIMMNTIYFTANCKRRQRVGNTLVIRTDDATVTITAGKITRVSTVHDTPAAPKQAAPKQAAPAAPKQAAPAAACECGKTHRAGSAASKRCQDARQAARNARTVIRQAAPAVTEPAVTEPATERFSALVVFRNGSSESRGGTLAAVTEWLGVHNPAIVESATITLAAITEPAAPKQAAPKQAAPKQAAPKQAAPKQARPAYRVHTDEVPDTAAGRRLAGLRAMYAAQV
jgi:hypothetical protein